jgi:hypothetical protein
MPVAKKEISSLILSTGHDKKKKQKKNAAHKLNTQPAAGYFKHKRPDIDILLAPNPLAVPDPSSQQ